jgi:hypothetical protein
MVFPDPIPPVIPILSNVDLVLYYAKIEENLLKNVLW